MAQSREETRDEQTTDQLSILSVTFMCLLSIQAHIVSARPFCHPEGNIFCHAGTGSVKGQALCFVRTPTFLIVAADADGIYEG
jgi:hypothetical protein